MIKENMKENMNLGISQSCSSTPSQEVKQIDHLLVLVGLLSLSTPRSPPLHVAWPRRM